MENLLAPANNAHSKETVSSDFLVPKQYSVIAEISTGVSHDDSQTSPQQNTTLIKPQRPSSRDESAPAAVTARFQIDLSDQLPRIEGDKPIIVRLVLSNSEAKILLNHAHSNISIQGSPDAGVVVLRGQSSAIATLLQQVKFIAPVQLDAPLSVKIIVDDADIHHVANLVFHVDAQHARNTTDGSTLQYNISSPQAHGSSSFFAQSQEGVFETNRQQITTPNSDFSSSQTTQPTTLSSFFSAASVFSESTSAVSTQNTALALTVGDLSPLLNPPTAPPVPTPSTPPTQQPPAISTPSTPSEIVPPTIPPISVPNPSPPPTTTPNQLISLSVPGTTISLSEDLAGALAGFDIQLQNIAAGEVITLTINLSTPTLGVLSTATSSGLSGIAITSTYLPATGIWQAIGSVAEIQELLGGLQFTPSSNQFGIATLSLNASGGGVTASQSVGLSVLAVDDLPALSVPLADQLTLEDASFSFTVPLTSFTDADPTDTLTYSATRSDGSALPSWLSFNPTTRVLSGTPQQSDSGTLSVRVTASDGTSSVSDDFVLTINPVNDAPVVAIPISDQTSPEDAAFSFTIPTTTFSDEENNTLTYNATRSDGSALPSWLSFNPTTRVLSGT
ncbi:MAG: putative Ig domain-containing protein, partial [Rickettsiales bacterium]|nr:putative Ig domain-containing protein [Rickettsiales bacterium]